MKWRLKAKGWVFISHSSKDYESVKIVRNYLEENGFSALMFYLKSLEDTKKSKLTQQLIKWEIEERNIFVLCNSKEAKKSPWVQEEIEYVKSFPEKIYVEIDIDKLKYEKCTQLSKLDKLMQRATLFFSYSYKDRDFVMKVYEYLKSEGFKIWEESNIKIGDSWIEETNKAIIEASKYGCILLFISKNYLESNWNRLELNTVLNLLIENKASILLIMIDEDVDLSDFSILKNHCFINVNEQNFENKKKELLNLLNKRILKWK